LTVCTVFFYQFFYFIFYLPQKQKKTIKLPKLKFLRCLWVTNLFKRVGCGGRI
jgi:hypothetical protein